MVSDARENTVGVIGLGAIGGHVARALSRAGWQVLGYDVRPQAYEQFPEARPCATVAELAAASNLVLIAVYDDDQLRAGLSGRDGILSADPLPAVVCVLSTVTLTTLRSAAEEADQSGVELIDCGVTGGQSLRTRGKIVVLAGGSAQALNRARPALEVFAEPLLHMGPLGAGMQAKLARNLMHYSGWYAAWEAATIAAACDIDVHKLIEAHRISNEISSGGGTNLLARGIGPGPADPDDAASIAARVQSADFARKDLGYVLELAGELGISLPGAELVLERIDEVVGLAGSDPLPSPTR